MPRTGCVAGGAVPLLQPDAVAKMHKRTTPDAKGVRDMGQFQSAPRGTPSRGSQVWAHVASEMPGETERTLPSAKATNMPPVCSVWVRYETQPLIGCGRSWNSLQAG